MSLIGFEKKWGGTKNLTKILNRKRAIILTKTWTDVKKVIRCNYIPNMKALAQVLIEKKKKKRKTQLALKL